MMIVIYFSRLSEKKIVNIADFGMARFTNEKEYYRQRSNIPVPIKWMAPESVLQKVYSEKSDVVCSIVYIHISSHL